MNGNARPQQALNKNKARRGRLKDGRKTHDDDDDDDGSDGSGSAEDVGRSVSVGELLGEEALDVDLAGDEDVNGGDDEDRADEVAVGGAQEDPSRRQVGKGIDDDVVARLLPGCLAVIPKPDVKGPA